MGHVARYMMAVQESRGDKARFIGKKLAQGNRSSGLGKGFCYGQCWHENTYFSIHPNNLEKGKACFKYCNIGVGSRRWFRLKC